MGCEAPWQVTGSFLKLCHSEGPPVGSHKTTKILRCRATVCELVHLCNMWNAVREDPPRRALYSPKMPTRLDNEQSIVAAGQAGNSDAFITLLNLDGCRTRARETEP